MNNGAQALAEEFMRSATDARGRHDSEQQYCSEAKQGAQERIAFRLDPRRVVMDAPVPLWQRRSHQQSTDYKDRTDGSSTEAQDGPRPHMPTNEDGEQPTQEDQVHEHITAEAKHLHGEWVRAVDARGADIVRRSR